MRDVCVSASKPSVPGASFSPEEDNFSLEKCIAHTVRKAGYKPVNNNGIDKMCTSVSARVRIALEGNSPDARYHRATYESSQRITAALLAEKYRSLEAGGGEQAVDLSDSVLVKNRFYRQDNLRFNPQLAEPKYGLSSRNKRALTLARWAHYGNGMTELGAAPSGVLLKISKILFTPNRDDRAMGSHVRLFAALPIVAVMVSLLGRGLFIEGLGRVVCKVGSSIRTEIQTLVGSFSAIAATAAFSSLICVAVSNILVSRSKLGPSIMELIESNHDKHIHRIYTLLNEAKDKEGALRLVELALKKKIGKRYCTNEGTPYLLSRLVQEIKDSTDAVDAKKRIQSTLGSYLTETNFEQGSPRDYLNSKSHGAELLLRENHFLALTNLIEHCAIHEDPDTNYMDVRHHVEAGAKSFRVSALNAISAILGAFQFKTLAENVNVMASDKFLEKRESDKKNSACASEMRYCGDNILTNMHQYGPVTRALAGASESLRVFNSAVVLSLNYQITRPVAWLSGRFAELVLKKPNSRATSFSIGRLVSSCFWAATDAFLLISLAAGRGVAFGGPEATTHLKFPLQVPLGPAFSASISVVSTALQMLVVAIPAGLLMAAAQGACYLEGWEGNIPRTMKDSSLRQRNHIQWA